MWYDSKYMLFCTECMWYRKHASSLCKHLIMITMCVQSEEARMAGSDEFHQKSGMLAALQPRIRCKDCVFWARNVFGGLLYHAVLSSLDKNTSSPN